MRIFLNFYYNEIITYELAINVHLNCWYATAVSPCSKIRLKYHLVNVKQFLIQQ